MGSGELELYEWMVANGVIREGHFVFTDGDHSPLYTDMANMLSNIPKAWELAQAQAVTLEPHKFETITAPPHADYGWGILLALAIHLNFGRKVNFAYAQETTETVEAVLNGEKKNLKVVTDEFDFPRQQAKFIDRHRVLIVCDVLSKGSTARKMIRAVQRRFGLVVGVAPICTHAYISEIERVPVSSSLIHIPVELHQDPCPPGLPPIDEQLGHGKEYREKKVETK